MKVVLSRRKLLDLNVIKEQSLLLILVWFDGKNEKKIMFKSFLHRYCLGESIRENLIKTTGNGGSVK